MASLRPVVLLLVPFLLMSTSLVSAQVVDSTSFEGNWGSFTPHGPSERPDYVSPQLVTKIAHTGQYSVEASAVNGQESFIGNFYANGVPVPFQVTIWVWVRFQEGGQLEFAKLWAFADSACSWLVALLRSSDGYAMIRKAGNQITKSNSLISINAWHKYSVAYDGRRLNVFFDETPIATEAITGSQKNLCAVNLGVLDNANSQSSTKAPDIGYGTVYLDDYSTEHVYLLAQTVTHQVTIITIQSSVTTVSLEIVPTWVYAAVPTVALMSCLLGYGIVRFQSRRAMQPPPTASTRPCVKCRAELPLDAKFCDSCGTSQQA